MTPVQVTWTQNKRYFVVLVKIFGFETFRIVLCSLHPRHFTLSPIFTVQMNTFSCIYVI